MTICQTAIIRTVKFTKDKTDQQNTKGTQSRPKNTVNLSLAKNSLFNESARFWKQILMKIVSK